MLVSLISGLLLTAAPAPPAPPGVRLAVSLDGTRVDALQRSIWVHEPSDAAFPRLRPGFGGSLSVELGISSPDVRWLTLFIGARGRLGVWHGATPDDAASLWDLGLRSRFEFALGPFSPWVGVGSSFGNVVARVGGVERQVAAHTYDLSAGLRVKVIGPVGLGFFVETQHASSFARPQEEFSTLRLGADLTLTFDLGSPSSAAASEKR